MAWTFYAVELRPYRKDQARECQQRLVLRSSVPGEGAYIVRTWSREVDIPSLPKVASGEDLEERGSWYWGLLILGD